MDLGAASVSVHIRKIRWHHLVNNSDSEVTRQGHGRHVQVVDELAGVGLGAAHLVGGADRRWLTIENASDRLLLKLDFISDGDHVPRCRVQLIFSINFS